MSLKWDGDAIADVIRSPGVKTALLEDGFKVARLAAQYAPRRTGDGARSIRAELARGSSDPEVRVSWDSTHFYLGFIELGTEDRSAESFLRRAANEFK